MSELAAERHEPDKTGDKPASQAEPEHGSLISVPVGRRFEPAARSTRTNLGLLAGMLGLVLLIMILTGATVSPSELATNAAQERMGEAQHDLQLRQLERLA